MWLTPHGTLAGWRSVRLSIPRRRSLGRNNSFQFAPGVVRKSGVQLHRHLAGRQLEHLGDEPVGVLTIRGVGGVGNQLDVARLPSHGESVLGVSGRGDAMAGTARVDGRRKGAARSSQPNAAGDPSTHPNSSRWCGPAPPSSTASTSNGPRIKINKEVASKPHETRESTGLTVMECLFVKWAWQSGTRDGFLGAALRAGSDGRVGVSCDARSDSYARVGYRMTCFRWERCCGSNVEREP